MYRTPGFALPGSPPALEAKLNACGRPTPRRRRLKRRWQSSQTHHLNVAAKHVMNESLAEKRRWLAQEGRAFAERGAKTYMLWRANELAQQDSRLSAPRSDFKSTRTCADTYMLSHGLRSLHLKTMSANSSMHSFNQPSSLLCQS